MALLTLSKAVPFIFFALFVVFGIFITGYVWVRRVSLPGKLTNIFLSVCLGFVLITLTSYLGGYLNFRLMTPLLVLFSAVYAFKFKLYRDFLPLPKVKLNAFSVVLFALLLAGIIFQSAVTFRSGAPFNSGVGFWGPTGHDGVWHQAVISQLFKSVPPENPVLAGATLTNYHYYYNLLAAETIRLTFIEAAHLVYRFYPVLFSILLGLGTYLLAGRLFRNKLAALGGVFFVYFGSSFGWVIDAVRGSRPLWGESAFWMNQPVSMNYNPPFAISLVLLIAAVLMLYHYGKKPNKTLLVLTVLVTGSLVGFKVYAAVVLLAGIFGYFLYLYFTKKDKSLFKVSVLSLGLFLILFLPQTRQAASLIEFEPLWFTRTMIGFPDRVGWERLANARSVYLAEGLWLKLVAAETLAIVIFIIGNLGTRIIAFFAVFKIIKAKLPHLGIHFLIFVMMDTALILPLLFVQKGNPWNTIQFAYYSLYFYALYAGAVFAFIKRKSLLVALAFGLLVLTPISSLATFKGSFSEKPHAYLPEAELEALNFLQEADEGAVLTYPFDEKIRESFQAPFPLFAYVPSAYVAAYSAKSSFVADEMQLEILQVDYQDRLDLVRRFFETDSIEEGKRYLEEMDIRYLYLPKKTTVEKDFADLGLTLIFSNEDVEVYEYVP